MWPHSRSLGVMLLFGLIEEALERLKTRRETKAPVEAEFIPPKPSPYQSAMALRPPPREAPRAARAAASNPTARQTAAQSHALPKSFDHGGAKAVWKLGGLPGIERPADGVIHVVDLQRCAGQLLRQHASMNSSRPPSSTSAACPRHGRCVRSFTI